jgi:hypothetical protein
MFSTLRMQMGSIDHTLKLAELGGRRLSLVFEWQQGRRRFIWTTRCWKQEAAGGTGQRADAGLV